MDVEFLDADPPLDGSAARPGADDLRLARGDVSRLDGAVRRLPWPVLAVAVAVALMTAVLVARGTSGSRGAQAASSQQPVARPLASSATRVALPDLRQPVPRLQLVPTPTCPGGCTVLAWVADATLHALDTAFPGAVVQQQMTAFGPHRFGATHPLLAREVRATAGRTEVVIDVVQQADVGRDLVSTQNTAVSVIRRGAVTSADAIVPGYRIVVRVTGGGRAAAHRLRVMLADPGLMAIR